MKESESGDERGIGMPVKARPWVAARGIWSAVASMKIEDSKAAEGMLLLKVSASDDRSRSRRMRLGLGMTIWRLSAGIWRLGKWVFLRRGLAPIDVVGVCCSYGGDGEDDDDERIRLRTDGRPRSWIVLAGHCGGA